MDVYRFGGQTAPTPQKPPCWGKSFEDGNRECRGCGFQGSCRDEVIRASMNRTVYPQVPQYQPYFQQQAPQVQYPQIPVAPPVQVPQYQPPQQSVLFSRLSRAAPQQQPQMMPQMMMPQIQNQQTSIPYGYGWVPDPMHHYVHTTPPVFRAQMPGESFGERMVKNIGLSMLESLFATMFLSVRQMVWGPEIRPQVIDAVPVQSHIPQTPQTPQQ